MLIGRTERGREENVASRPTARQTANFRQNFDWALAYARCACGDNRHRLGRGLGWDHRQNRLAGKCWVRRLGKSRSQPLALTMASSLFSAAFLALDGSSVSLTGVPGPPTLRGFPTGMAAITSLRPSGQEPAFAIFKEASATARVPTMDAAWLTRRQRAGTLKWAHGRVSSRAVRRREGGTSRRYFAPTAWTPLVQGPAPYTCQITCSNSHTRGHAEACGKQGQCRDRPIAEWLNWLCESGSLPDRC
jgi:hypothetical protein